MTFDQVINVARGYRAMLQDKRRDIFFFDSGEHHVIEMVNEMEAWGPERKEKAFRWLGFIQGALWMLNWYDIAEMKRHNRTGEVKP